MSSLIQTSQMDNWTENGSNEHDEQLASETNQRTEDGKQLHGDHEIQESEGGEGDLHIHFIECKKNPGHHNFIPVDKFSLKHLPEGHQNNDLYELIKVIADLTVRVDVKMTSEHRLEFWPETIKPYPFYNLRGKSVLRTGTGMVCDVSKYTNGRSEDVRGGKHKMGYNKCWCTECKKTKHFSSVWWEFIVLTATHVVFDEIEAGHTTLKLFYDRDDTSVDIHNRVSHCEIYHANTGYDNCRLECVICDENIGDKLYRSWKHYSDTWVEVKNKRSSTRDSHRMTIIVSHPHGCSKLVSVGQWQDKYESDRSYKFTYKTDTCPGSSGAHVLCVGYHGAVFFDPVHSGCKSGLNYSSFGHAH